jgi:hypothetical protein
MLSRRAALISGAAVLVNAALPPGARAALAARDRDTLARLARDLFPHAILADKAYRAIVDVYLPANAGPERLTAAAAAVQAVDGTGPAYMLSPEAERRARLATVIGQPFIQGLRFSVLLGLYADLSITRRFGYQGPSIDEGGYIDRGFDTLPWLPSPSPEVASRWPV